MADFDLAIVALADDTATAGEPSSGPAIGPDSPERFINRELSWLDFNRRVLEEAENARHPLLERLRFVSISAGNLDEFYSVRVAGLIGQAKAGVLAASPDGRTPAQQLAEVETQARALMAEQQRVWRELRAALAESGIVVAEPGELSDHDRAWLDAWFMERVFPVLTPLAIDPAHPFPFIPNMGLVMALLMLRDEDGHAMRSLIPLPAQVERFIRLPPPSDGAARADTRLDDAAALPDSASASSGGCGCGVAGSDVDVTAAGALGSLLVALLARRRRCRWSQPSSPSLPPRSG